MKLQIDNSLFSKCKRMLSLAVATVMSVGALGINNEVYAADPLRFGNYGNYCIYIATEHNPATSAGQHGANHKSQLDPAAVKQFETQDKGHYNKAYISNIVWLSPSASNISMWYSRYTTDNKYDCGISSCKSWTITRLAGSGTVRKETLACDSKYATCPHLKFSGLRSGDIFETVISSVGTHSGAVAYMLVGNMEYCIPKFLIGTTPISNTNNSYYLVVRKGETKNINLRYTNYDIEHTYTATQSDSNVTKISGLNGKPTRDQVLTIQGLRPGKNIITFENTTPKVSGYKIAPDARLVVTVEGVAPVITKCDVSIADRSVTITATDSDGTVEYYGYAASGRGTDSITWQRSNVITGLSKGKWDFYAMDNDGEISEPSTQDLPAIPAGVTIEGYKDTYYVGETFVPQGKIKATYDDGTTRETNLSNYYCKSLNTTYAGPSKLVVTWAYKDYEFPVTVLPKEHTITIKTVGATAEDRVFKVEQNSKYSVEWQTPAAPEIEGFEFMGYSESESDRTNLRPQNYTYLLTDSLNLFAIYDEESADGNKRPYIIPEDSVYGLDVPVVKIAAADDDGQVVEYGYTLTEFDGRVPSTSEINWQTSDEFDLRCGEYMFYAKDNEGAISKPFLAQIYKIEEVSRYVHFTKPDKTEYFVGDKIDTTGGSFELNWVNYGKLDANNQPLYGEYVTQVFPLKHEWADPYDNTKVGEQDIRFRYPGITFMSGAFTATFKAGDPNEVVGIKVEGQKEEYLLNEDFVEQGTVYLVYGDGRIEEAIDLQKRMLTGFDTSTPGVKVVDVQYYGEHAEYKITVTDPNDHGKVTSLTVSDTTPTFEKDAPFDGKGTLHVTYEDGTTEDLSLAEEMLTEGFDTSTVGTAPILVEYKDKTTTFDIEVVDNTKDPDDHGKVTGITVSGTTPTYEKDEPFDGKGTVHVVYEDGTTEDIPLTEDMLGGFDTSETGTKPITVTFDGQTTTFEIEVIDDTKDPDDHGAITGITVSGVTTEYEKDEPFDKKGTITIEYEDGTTKDIPLTEDMLDGFDTSTPGTITVTVTYEGNETDFEIEVTESIIDEPDEKEIKNIKVIGITKNYLVDDPFDGRGHIVIVYSDYSVDDVTVTEDMLTNFDTSAPGTVTVTLTYEDFTEDYVINVDEPFMPAGEIAEISVYDYVDEYMVYDDFIKQGTVAINYTDDTTDEVPLQKDMLTGFETNEVGNVNVIVTLGEATTDYDITVRDLEREIVGIKVSGVTTSYEVGDDFDGNGIVTIYYDDGTSKEIDLTDDMLDGFDTGVEGKVEVMVVYEDFADTYVITITSKSEPEQPDKPEQPEPEKPHIIGITASGIQTNYTKGDSLNTNGGKVTITWSDGTTTTVDLTPDMVTGFDTNKVGTYPITIEHEGFTTDVTITIKAPTSGNTGGNGSSGSSGSGSGGSGGSSGGSSHKKPSKPSTSTSTSTGDTTTIDDTKTPLVDKPSVKAPGLDSEGNQFKLNIGIGLHSLGDKGYIAGYPDATFKPAQGITRAEFAAILYRVFTFDSTKTAKQFVDVKPEAWYYAAVQTLTANNIIYGYPNNEFKPNDKITVADALLMLGRLIDLSGYADTTDNKYVANSTYSKEALARAINSGIVGNDVNVDTSKEITREQVVKFINNIIYDTLETSKQNRFVDINTSMETYKDIIKAAILK